MFFNFDGITKNNKMTESQNVLKSWNQFLS